MNTHFVFGFWAFTTALFLFVLQLAYLTVVDSITEMVLAIENNFFHALLKDYGSVPDPKYESNDRIGCLNLIFKNLRSGSGS